MPTFFAKPPGYPEMSGRSWNYTNAMELLQVLDYGIGETGA
jgi:hypothetical protein